MKKRYMIPALLACSGFCMAGTASVATPAAAPAASGGASVEIAVPTMGESVAEGSIGTWLKKSGDTVAKDELLVEIETDKVAVEVSAPAAGVLTIVADNGSTVTPGQLIGSISASGAAAAPAAAPVANDHDDLLDSLGI